MPDDIERLIYKLELDGSGYINGVESLSNSTKKLTADQEKSNEALKKSEAALKQQSEYLAQAKKDLDSYSGSNEKYRQQLEKSFKSAQADNQKLNDSVLKNKQAYEQASKAAQDFANISAKATSVQQQTTGGKIPTGPGITSGITSQIAGVINVADFTKQAQIVEQTKNEFDDLRISIGLAEARMKQLNTTDEEFQQLAPIVQKGKEALQQYDQATEKAGQSTFTLRSRILQGREELVRLQQAGKGTTQQYIQLEKEVAKLTDEFGDQQARIKTLASDTKLLDFGKASITAATSAFQAYTAVSILAGGENEELQKKTLQLFAAMQLLQSLEQLSNLTRREGALATLAQAGAQSAYTAVVGASTGALKAFRIALASTGILAAVVLIGYLVNKWLELKAAQEKAAIAQKALVDINKKAVDSFAEEVTHIKLLNAEYQNLNTSAKRKKDIQDELQKSYPSYFKDLDTHADKEKYIAEQTEKVTKAIILQAKIQGAQSLLAEKFQDLLKKQFDPKLATDFGDKLISSFKHLTDAGAKADLAKTARSNIKKAEEEYNAFEKFITNFVINSNAELDQLGGDPHKQLEKTKTEKAIKTLENDFEKKKAELDARLAALRAKEAQDEQSIRDEFAAKLAKEQLEIEKSKNLTKPQKTILKNELGDINDIELTKALDDFRKKVVAEREKLYTELATLQDKNTENTINLLQDEFDRRAELIRFNEDKEIVDAIEANQKRLAAFESSAALIYGKDYQNNKNFLDRKAILVAAGEQVITDIVLKAENQRKDLSADIFKSLLNAFDDAINISDLVSNEHEAKALQDAKQNFLTRKITYEQFEKEITKIQKDYERKRLDDDLTTKRNQLKILNDHIALIKDTTSQEYKDLIKLQEKYRKDIAEGEKQQATDTDPTGKDNNINKVAAYAEAIGQVADSVIQFWRAANDAESAALDRSIALQQRRVDAAQRIADRGNAQYLKAEEDRLTELNIKRENAARKQLGIDAALQASQILVGITGAISKIATPGIGAAETIAEIAIIIGALATGYGLVKSLQGNQPKLAKGTKFLRRDGQPSGTDTIPVILDEGEAVIPKGRNKAYHPTVAAIYDGTVPADHLNNFVKNYHQIKSVPQPDYSRIKDAAELSIGQDGRMHVAISEQNKLINENNDLQRQTLRAMKSMNVSANIDRNGVAIMVNEYMEQMKIDSRV